jgi:hypothetical protein
LKLAYDATNKSYVAQGKFGAIATYAGSSIENFYGLYYQLKGSSLEVVPIFYPEYYRSLVARLYNFNGEEVMPQGSTVFSYEEKLSSGGIAYKQITSMKSFPSYEEAEAYVASQKSGNYRLGGTDPFVSPVPLEKLEHYKLVYSSEQYKWKPVIGTVPEVKIFEYIE